ncbi:xk-related 7 [Paramuricea clavata]|uniref:XK-related protein n=1 Tax=Paramuricea clavata TaxID=317549 RepID=A0A6S7HT02_PARCT|nr:xk-related 7 [Paramuricea clavata]
MRGKDELPFLILGVLLYTGDVISDSFVAYQYYKRDQWWWFGLTLTFVIVPFVVINIAALIQTKIFSSDENDPPREGRCLNLMCRSLFYFGLPIIFRYLEEYWQWKSAYCENLPCSRENCEDSDCESCKSHHKQKRKLAKSAYKLAWLRHIETVTESIPQWCLQVYIMLRQWYFPWYTLVSIVVSLLSSAWSITALEKARHKKNAPNELKCISKVVLWNAMCYGWQMFALTSRLSAIVFCAYVLRFYVVVFIAAHFLIATLYHDLWFGNGFGCLDLGWFLVIHYCLFFHVSESLLCKFHKQDNSENQHNFQDVARLRSGTLKINISLAFRNILMLIISVMVSEPDMPHIDEIKRIVIPSVPIVGLFGVLFCIGYFICDSISRAQVSPTDAIPEPNPAVQVENRDV